MGRIKILSLLLVLSAFATDCFAADEIPRNLIWAWESPTDLSSLERRDIGIAFLIATVEGRKNKVTVRMRRAHLGLPANPPPLIPVVRIHSYDRVFEPDDEEAFGMVLAVIEKVLHDTHSRRLQIDFDAKASERPFYTKLLSKVRSSLCRTGECFLSITALGSWCLPGDFWMAKLPVDEVVPMAFSMGTMIGEKDLLESLEKSSWPCDAAVGVLESDNERQIAGRRKYFFRYGSWTSETVERMKVE